MAFTLIPICSEIGHELQYQFKTSYNCEICNKTGISYRCINCEYGRCKDCHQDIVGSENISKRLKNGRINNDIRLAEINLEKDGLTQWRVSLTDEEICYVNNKTKTRTFDYPISASPPPSPLGPRTGSKLQRTSGHYKTSHSEASGHKTSHYKPHPRYNLTPGVRTEKNKIASIYEYFKDYM